MVRHPLSFASGMLIGLGIMYFFDPYNGMRRRARLRDAFASKAREAIDRATVAGDDAIEGARDLSSATAGIGAEGT